MKIIETSQANNLRSNQPNSTQSYEPSMTFQPDTNKPNKRNSICEIMNNPLMIPAVQSRAHQ